MTLFGRLPTSYSESTDNKLLITECSEVTNARTDFQNPLKGPGQK